MAGPKISAYWAAITGVITFFVGTVATPVIDFIHHDQELSDHERDFVMRIVELVVTHPEQAVQTAALSSAVAHEYLHGKEQFAQAFSDVVAAQALSLAGARAASGSGATGPGSGKANQGGAPAGPGGDAAGAASLLGQVGAAVTVSEAVTAAKASGATQSPAVQAVLTPTKGRVFFQFAQAEERSVSAALRGQLGQILPGEQVNGDELVANYSGGTEVRYFYPGDRDEANQVAAVMASAFPGLTCKRIGGYDGAGKVKPRLFEVWIGRGAKPTGPLRPQPASALCG